MSVELYFPPPDTNSDDALAKGLNTNTTKDGNSPVVSTPVEVNPQAPNSADNQGTTTGGTTLVSGNANDAQSAIKKSNETVSHACDKSTYVGKAVYYVGMAGGYLIQGIRKAIKAILTALGFNQSSSGIVSALTKIKNFINDTVKFIKKITDAIQQVIAYINAIKQLLSYILSLPAILLTYFKDCIKELKSQLVTGYQKGLGDVSLTDLSDAQIKEITDGINSIKTSIQSFTQATAQLTTTVAAGALSLVTPTQFAVANTQMQAQATTDVFTAAGFPDQAKNYGGKP